MKILNVRPAAQTGGGRFRNVAIFDAEVLDGLVLCGLRLALAPDGKRFVFSPASSGSRFARIGGEYAKRLAEAAWVANGGVVANGLH